MFLELKEQKNKEMKPLRERGGGGNNNLSNQASFFINLFQSIISI